MSDPVCITSGCICFGYRHGGLCEAGQQKQPESILEEAQRLTHGTRVKDYGYPLDDYTRTAALISALLAHKLKEPLLPHEAAMIQCCVKLSRQVHSPKRDNMVDLAGYAWVSQECLDEEQRRADKALDQFEPAP